MTIATDFVTHKLPIWILTYQETFGALETVQNLIRHIQTVNCQVRMTEVAAGEFLGHFQNNLLYLPTESSIV